MNCPYLEQRTVPVSIVIWIEVRSVTHRRLQLQSIARRTKSLNKWHWHWAHWNIQRTLMVHVLLFLLTVCRMQWLLRSRADWRSISRIWHRRGRHVLLVRMRWRMHCAVVCVVRVYERRHWRSGSLMLVRSVVIWRCCASLLLIVSLTLRARIICPRQYSYLTFIPPFHPGQIQPLTWLTRNVEEAYPDADRTWRRQSPHRLESVSLEDLKTVVD